MGSSALLFILLMSFIHSGLNQDLPTSTLTVTPDSPVFTGETVNLKCEIETYSDWIWRNYQRNDWTHEWRYEWYKDSSKLQKSERHTVTRDTLSIVGAVTSDQGQYWCRGQRDGRPNSSHSSSAVSLSVSVTDSPTSTLTVTPDRSVFTGERVNLKCVIETYRYWIWRNYQRDDWRDWTHEWRYEWYKSSRESVKLQRSERHTVYRDTLSIVKAVTSDQDQYWCRGLRDGRPNSSQSSSVSLSVKERPKPVVRVQPDVRVFRGETVTLTCDIQETGVWWYSWYKDQDYSRRQVQIYYSAGQDKNYKITSVDQSHAGVYSCRGTQTKASQYSERSDKVTLTVSGLKPKPELTSDPAGAALTGNTVNLTCRMDPSTGYWDFYWYKHTLNPETEKRETNSYRLKIDSVSDGGQYWCRAGRGKPVYYTNYSDALWVNVTAPQLSSQSSSLLVIGVSVGLSFFLLFLVSLVLLWRHKNNKDHHRNTQQTSDSNRSGESHVENSPLQPGSDHIYDDVAAVNSGDKDPMPSSDITYSEVTVEKKRSVDKDINTAGPSDLTYAQINIQDKKKSKGKGAGLADVLIKMKSKEKYKGKSSESGDTLYSELNHNTDRGVDAEVGDATYAQVLKKKGHKKNKTRP